MQKSSSPRKWPKFTPGKARNFPFLKMISSSALAASKRKRSSLSKTDFSSPSGKSAADESPQPSRIPVKSSSPAAGLGGMAVAYSPAAPPVEAAEKPAAAAATRQNLSTQTTNPEDYSRKLQELRTAMELLKTPPKKNQIAPSPTAASSPLNRSWSLEHLAADGGRSGEAASSFLRLDSSLGGSELNSSSDSENSLTDASSVPERQEIESIISRLDQADQSSAKIEHPMSATLHSAPSSPCMSSEELKRRLEATREAFQRSLAQVSSPPPQHHHRLASDSAFSDGADLLAQLERRSSQLRHVPVTFDDLEEEAQRKMAELAQEESELERDLSKLENSLSPISLRRTSSQVDAIRQELEQIRAESESTNCAADSGSNALVLLFSTVMLVGAVALTAVLKMHWESGNLPNLEQILMQAEAFLNYILQD